MLPEEENGLLLNEKQIQDFRAARNKMWYPQSLSALAINSVATNLTRFTDVPDSALQYLPNTIVQQLLSKIASDMENEKIYDPPPHLRQVLVLLLNPYVTELDCTVFSYSCHYYIRDLVNHALKNCPKIRKIKVNGMRASLDFGCIYGYQDVQDVSQLECLKKCWNNLTSIKLFDESISFNEGDMMFLQENFPNIEELTVRLFVGDDCPKTVLNHLVNMKRLHSLIILDVQSDDTCIYCKNSKVMEFIVDVAGTVPSLRYFGIYSESNGIRYGDFVDLFGEKYPYKKLLIEFLSILDGPERNWPKNLAVKSLKIDGSLSDSEIENLSTIECKFDLFVERWFVAQQIYKMLDCIGGRVQMLTIETTGEELVICLERILAACPNLEHFKFYYPDNKVIQEPKYIMSPAAFKNYKSFVIEVGRLGDYAKEVVLQQVYRNFLIGTEVCETLDLQYNEQLETLAQVALAYPESLQQLRELHATFLSQSEYDDAKFEKHYEYFYVLLTCCHNLERIFYYLSHTRYARELLIPVNRYLAAINSIDLNFIQVKL